MKGLLKTLSICLMSGSLLAQDPHFSQFYAAPLTLNPALTGAFSGNYRLLGIFRGQWGEVLRNEAVPMYRTYAFSADFRTNKGIGKNDAFGVGASFLGDQAGELKYGTNQFGIGVSYFKSLDQRANHYLALVIQAEVFQRTLGPGRAQFVNQWDGTAYNPLLPSNEAFVNTNFMNFTLGTGLLYYWRINRRTNIYLGASVYHLNRPTESFKDNSDVKVPMKISGHGGFRFPVKGRFDLQPKFVVISQGKSIQLNFGADARILFQERDPDGNNFRFGFLYRLVGGDKDSPWNDQVLNSEALILTTGIDYNGLSLNVAYDINVSELITASRSRGAFEVGVSYTGKFNPRKPTRIYCPRF